MARSILTPHRSLLPTRQTTGTSSLTLDQVEAEYCKRHLHAFIQKAWSIIEPEQTFVDNWHIVEACAVLEDVAAGKLKRVIINIPPGCMKSLLVAVMFCAWVWARNAKLRFIDASYSTHLTIRDNLKVRDIVQSPWYQSHYKVQFASDQNAKELIKTTEGGWRYATSIGGGGTGEHPDFFVFDDPHTAEQAASKIERDSALKWFDRTASTRGVARDVAIIGVMQRLNVDDLCGHLLARGGWTLVKFPMRYVESRPKTEKDDGYEADPRDPRRVHGELLWPAVFTEEKVRQLELDLGPIDSAGQLQQSPVAEGGNLFKREWFKIIDRAPAAVTRRVRGWDTAATEGGGDWTVGVRMAETVNESVIVEDVVRGQWSPANIDANMKLTAQLDGTTPQREEKEPGSAGVSVLAARAKLLKGHDYKGIPISGSKIVRCKPFRSQCEAGNVYLVRGAWNKQYIDELCDFPNGKNDDDVDASSCTYNSLVQEVVIAPAHETKLAGF